MESINLFGFIHQILNFVLFIIWIALVISAFNKLGKDTLSDRLQLIWSVIILLIPLIGALAYLLVRRNNTSTSDFGR